MQGTLARRLETFDNDLFMVISTVAYVDHQELTGTSEVVATGQLMIFLGDHFMITVRRGEHAQLSGLRRTLEADAERLARGPSEVHVICDRIIGDYPDVVAESEKDLDEVETSVFSRQGVAIVAVPTMIAGIYGMSFTNMPDLGTRYGYYVVPG
ncbi:MAG TPA: CorA family divalent cation transporter [Propionibacteriaceae bacterium]|nr:CorA family divalent cation transporter [Propionibacteriaceae bacterium]